MKLNLFGKTYLWGKSKAEYRERIAQTAKDTAELVLKQKSTEGALQTVLDEYKAIVEAFSGEQSPFHEQQGDLDKIVRVTSLLAEQLRFILAMKLALDRGKAPSRNEMKEVFEGDGPLAKFGDRITTCAVLGIIPLDMKNDLRILKGIRNEHAAHSYQLASFDDPNIAAACSRLKMRLSLKPDRKNANEQRFIESSMMIYLALTFVIFVIVEETKVINANFEAIKQSAVGRWNEILKEIGLPEMAVPL